MQVAGSHGHTKRHVCDNVRTQERSQYLIVYYIGVLKSEAKSFMKQPVDKYR